MLLGWWHSVETISKLINIIAVLIILLGIASLVLKIRSDHLKARTDSDRKTERLLLDTQLREATSALASQVSPRQMTATQLQLFHQSLSAIPAGKVTLVHSVINSETIDFLEQLEHSLRIAGFEIKQPREHAMGYTIPLSAPWFLALIVGPGNPPFELNTLIGAFRDAGITGISAINGDGIASCGEIKLYVGSR